MRTIKYVIFVFLVFALFSCEKQEFTNLADSDIVIPAPTEFVVSQLSVTSCLLEWEDNSDGEAGFKIDRKDKDEDWALEYNIVGENEESWIDTNLVAGAHYQYRIYSYISKNRSVYQEQEIDLNFPKPTNFQATINSISTCILTWNDNSINETGFAIDRKQDDQAWINEYKVLAENSEVYQDTLTEGGSKYQYRIYGYSGNYHSEIEEVEVDFNQCLPSDFAITVDSFTSCKLSWSYDSVGGEEGFKIFRCLLGNEWQETALVDAEAREFIDTDLTDGERYQYEIYPFNNHLLESNSVFAEIELPPLTIIDIDGNIYNVVQIGEQFWINENLKVGHYRNGDPIQWLTLQLPWCNTTDGAFCHYSHSDNNYDIYGNLYNWYATIDERGLAPEGWRIPSDTDVKNLEIYLGMSQAEANDNGWRGFNEGAKMAGNEELWGDGWIMDYPSFGLSGLDLIPGGYRGAGGVFHYSEYYSQLWTSTSSSTQQGWMRCLGKNDGDVEREDSQKYFGLSVRCIWGE